MNSILTVEEMADADKHAMQMGIPSMVLMERAALSAVDEIIARKYDLSNILILCGPGNNGGDGACIARLLAERGISSDILLFGNPDKRSEQLKIQLKICDFYNINFVSEYQRGRYTLVIDAIYGIGLYRAIEGETSDIIKKINDDTAKVVAVDISSGISGNTGKILGTALLADLTITFAARKIGHCFYPGAAYSGEVVVKNIGIPIQQDRLVNHIYNIEETDLDILPKRDESGNKGTFGKLLIIAGSQNICGAAYLCACAALKCGIGMVMIFTEESNRVPLSVLLPEALITTYKEGAFDAEQLKSSLDWADSVVIGPGLGKSRTAVKIVNSFFNINTLPAVFDADALNIISENSLKGCLGRFSSVVTPHMAEMSRLTGISIAGLKDSPIEAAREYASSNSCVCVLKDARTVIAYPDGRAFINLSGCSALATAGSGDVLSGIIGGYRTRFRMEKDIPIEAISAYLHGKAGENAAELKSSSSVTATDLLTMLEKNNY